jgi:hypothetical protein
MANTILTPSVIAAESLRLLKNQMVAGGIVHRQFKKEFVKIGDTVTIRKPVKFLVSDGATRSNQDVTETSTTVVINKRKHVSWKFSTQDLTLKIEEYSERYIRPATLVLADQVDLDTLDLLRDAYFSVGTPGTTPNAFSILGDAATKLDNAAVPPAMRRTVFSPAANWVMADALKTLLNAGMNEDFVRRGSLGNIAGSEIYRGQNVPKHTNGARGGTPLVNTGSQTGASLITDGWTAAAAPRVKRGDVFTIANVNAVNPVNKLPTGQLMQFVVTADGSSDGSGNLTLAISPAIVTSGPYQNVDAGPADNAALTFVGTASTIYPQNGMFHRDAFALVTVPLELPDSAGFKSRAEFDGLSIRVVKDYDIDADEEIIRLDILYGVKAIYPELAVRIWG